MFRRLSCLVSYYSFNLALKFTKDLLLHLFSFTLHHLNIFFTITCHYTLFDSLNDFYFAIRINFFISNYIDQLIITFKDLIELAF